MGRRRPKGADTKAAQFAFAPEMFPHHKVEASAPALLDWRLCQKAAKAALPTAWRRLRQTWRPRIQPHGEGSIANGRQLSRHLEAALPRRPSWSYAFVRAMGTALHKWGRLALLGGDSNLVCQTPGPVA